MRKIAIVAVSVLFLTGSGLLAQTNLYTLEAPTGTNIGYGGHMGDVNGDGYDDIISGSQYPFGPNTVLIWAIDEFGLDGDVDKVIKGPAGVYFGATVAVGDLNGDSIDDIAVSAPKDTVSDIPGVGGVYVYYGSSTFTSGDTVGPADADVFITRATPIANEWYGWNLAILDYNGDGTDDLAIGGLYTDGLLGRIEIRYGPDVGDTTAVAGKTYDQVLIGPADSTKGKPDWGNGPSYFTGGALDVGDFNKDGKDDIFSSHYGWAAHGKGGGGVGSIWLGGDGADGLADHFLYPPWAMQKLEAYLYFAYRAVNAGDVDNDGADDWLGVSHSWGVGMLWSGERGLGQADTTGTNTSAALDTVPLVTVIYPGATYGYNSSTFSFPGALGDINGDGYDDFAIADPKDSTEVATGKNGDGSVHVFLGGKGPTGTADVVMHGATGSAENFGSGMFSVGDVNGDEIDDFAVSATESDKIYIYSGTGLTAGIADSDLLPEGFVLSQNYPNPFNPNTEISYQIPVEAKVTLRVHNMLGQEVKTMVSEIQAPGVHKVSWDGLDNSGQMVASGVYTYQLNFNGAKISRKMLLMR
jgi:hypothetical protein